MADDETIALRSGEEDGRGDGCAGGGARHENRRSERCHREAPAFRPRWAQQTSQHIAAGVRQSIQEDFSLPIEAAVKGPIAELDQATYHARSVMAELSKESRFQTWTWLGMIFFLGFLQAGSPDTLSSSAISTASMTNSELSSSS